MIMEKNRKHLKDALENLPQLQPEEQLWENITGNLAEKGNYRLLRTLRQIEPPEEIWDSIDRQLTAMVRHQRRKAGIRIIRWSLAAAAVLAGGIIVFSALYSEKNTLRYSEEWILSADPALFGNSDTAFYRNISSWCREKPEICQSSEFIKMKNELEFLDKSKQTVLDRLNKYEPDEELKSLLFKIDRERDGIIHDLSALIN